MTSSYCHTITALSYYNIQVTISPFVSDNNSIQVNQKLLYRESDWWDVGLVVQKARKQGTVWFGRILQLTVLILQMKKPRTVIVVGSKVSLTLCSGPWLWPLALALGSGPWLWPFSGPSLHIDMEQLGVVRGEGLH